MNNKQASPEKRPSLLHDGLYLLSMLIFGTNGLLVARLSLSASQIVLLRTLIGGAALTAVVLLRGGFDRSAMLVLLLSPLLFREKLRGAKLAALGLVAVGLVCISGSIKRGSGHAPGLAAGLLSALFYAALIVFNKRIKRSSGLQTAAIELDTAFVVVLVYVLLTSSLPRPQRADLPYLAVIGLVNTALAYLLYFSAVQRLSGQTVALLSYADPVSALLFSALFLREALTPLQLLGAVLIIGGAALGERGGTRSSEP